MSALTAVDKGSGPGLFCQHDIRVDNKDYDLQAQAIITLHFVDRLQNSVRPLQRGWGEGGVVLSETM